MVDRPAEDLIEIEGATPRIIDEATWRRVDEIIRDPERVRRKCAGRHYELASRVRCGLCGSAMVGQTLTTKGKPYSYYRCRHAYDKNSGHECSGRYVQAQGLEDAVWGEIRRVLSSPMLALERAAGRLRSQEPAQEDIALVRRELKYLDLQERRLVELYVDGSFNKDVLDERQAALRQRRQWSRIGCATPRGST